MVEIFKSRFTPGVIASKIRLEIGETVKYKLQDGTVIDAIIKSKKMTHRQCPSFGYEALMLDNNTVGFIDVSRIVSWDGKDSF